MLHDLSITAAQAAYMGEWVAPEGADVMLALDAGVLTVAQSDDRFMVNPDGSEDPGCRVCGKPEKVHRCGDREYAHDYEPFSPDCGKCGGDLVEIGRTTREADTTPPITPDSAVLRCEDCEMHWVRTQSGARVPITARSTIAWTERPVPRYADTDEVRANCPRGCWPDWLADFDGERIAVDQVHPRAQGGFTVRVFGHTGITVSRVFDRSAETRPTDDPRYQRGAH